MNDETNFNEPAAPPTSEGAVEYLCPQCRATDNHAYIDGDGRQMRACGRCMIQWQEKADDSPLQAFGSPVQPVSPSAEQEAREFWIATAKCPTCGASGMREINGTMRCQNEQCSVAYTLAKYAASLRERIVELEKDNENLLWNLGGCDAIAAGWSKPFDYAKEAARPALDTVSRLTQRLESAEASLSALKLGNEELEKEIQQRNEDDNLAQAHFNSMVEKYERDLAASTEKSDVQHKTILALCGRITEL
jgi:Zn ribbon nucleic-acid-binding protein